MHIATAEETDEGLQRAKEQFPELFSAPGATDKT